jgi:hypothetical protein
MRVGFSLPISGRMADPDTIVRVAREGEALGYNYLTLTDHIVLPDLKVPGYPYSESGEFFSEGPEWRHDQLTTAAFVAAHTSDILEAAYLGERGVGLGPLKVDIDGTDPEIAQCLQIANDVGGVAGKEAAFAVRCGPRPHLVRRDSDFATKLS